MDQVLKTYLTQLKKKYGTCGKKELAEEETKCHKITEREIFEKFYNLNEDELSTKSNKNVFVKNAIMANIIKHCRGKRKEV